eukprot:Skav223707  [mRNA]  locus=scaffold2379:70914:75548:+ [translate_table: standard]
MVTQESTGRSKFCFRVRFNRIWIQVLLLIACIRIGEASHPGPSQSEEPFVIGCANSTGLLGKAALSSQLPGLASQQAIWGFSETHLTAKGVEQFQKDLRFSTNRKQHFIPGAPANHLSSSSGSIGGDARGVGFLTNVAGRPLTHDWDDNSWTTGRLQAAAFHSGALWFRIGIAYGFAHNSHTARTKAQTNHLLGLLTRRIVAQSHGPRIIMGDWNMALCDVEWTQMWKDHGFFDLQEFAHLRWSQDIQYTYKQKSTIDHIWCSRELAPWIQSVHVDASWYTDHSIVYACLKVPTIRRPPQIWVKPKAMQWDEVPEYNECAPATILDADSTRQYRGIMHQLEQHVDQALLSQGKPGLTPPQLGRAATHEAKAGATAPPSLRRSRPCDDPIHFVGDNWQHYHWVRQNRRLKSLDNLLRSHLPDTQKSQQAQSLWQSILAARGFPGGFRNYWKHRMLRLAQVRSHLPTEVPSAHQVQLIAMNFSAEVKALEATLNQHRQEQAKLVRLEDPARLYQDLKAPRPLPVQTLVLQNRAEALAIDEYDVVEVAPASLTVGEPVMHNHQVIAIQWLSDTTFQLLDDVELAPGADLHQPEFLADPQLVLRQFEQMWQPRWDKHRHVPETTWQSFCDKIPELLARPMHDMPWQPISEKQWYAAVRSKPSKSATGPDGISKADLLRMPATLTRQLLAMLTAVEAGNPWPDAMMTGLITAIEKVEHAQTPNQFRPICILSMTYRVWASIRAKQLIQWLSRHSPEGLYGNRTGCDTSRLWWTLAAQLESTIVEGGTLSGTLGDIVKCFNTLPRTPVMSIAAHMRVPPQLLRPWLAATCQLERRFVVMGEVGRPLRSSTGFAEGDPLSVCAMMLLNIALDSFLRVQHPQTRLLTYVDNIEIVGEEVHDVISAVDTLKSYCHQLDLELDQPKQLFWSTSPQGRKELRGANIKVTYNVRDLGGQMTYCRKHANGVIRTRIKNMQHHWFRLARSQASYHRKILSLTAAAWPKALHGVSITILGPTHVASLRTGAMKGLGCKNRGISPMLHLSFLHPGLTDPGFYILWQTVASFRRYADRTIVWPTLDALVSKTNPRQDPGPCSVLLQRLHDIAWSWHGEGWIQDHENLWIHLHDSPVQMLRARLQQAWFVRVGTELAGTRTSFAGLHDCDPVFSIADSNDMSVDDQAVLRVVMNGAFYTRDNLVHSGKVETKTCPWCPATDSVAHRHWSCPFMSEVWGSVDEGFHQRLQGYPDSTQKHGWFPRLPRTREWLHHLMNLPDLTDEWLIDPPLTGVLQMFTDGSAAYPSEPRLRLATWGFVLGDLQTDQFIPVGRGPVPGYLQTVLRAEILGAISALKFLLQTTQQGILWVDNLAVCNNVEMYQQGAAPPGEMETNHDLWTQLHTLVQQVGPRLLRCVKVPSHEDIHDFSEVIEQWVLKGNKAADIEAARAREDLPLSLIQCWHAMIHDHEQQVTDKRILHKHFLQIGHRAISHGSTRAAPEEEIQTAAAQTSAATAEEEALPIQFSLCHHYLMMHKLPCWENVGQRYTTGYNTINRLRTAQLSG